jgi:hypothetical protein
MALRFFHYEGVDSALANGVQSLFGFFHESYAVGEFRHLVFHFSS